MLIYTTGRMGSGVYEMGRVGRVGGGLQSRTCNGLFFRDAREKSLGLSLKKMEVTEGTRTRVRRFISEQTD